MNRYLLTGASHIWLLFFSAMIGCGVASAEDTLVGLADNGYVPLADQGRLSQPEFGVGKVTTWVSDSACGDPLDPMFDGQELYANAEFIHVVGSVNEDFVVLNRDTGEIKGQGSIGDSLPLGRYCGHLLLGTLNISGACFPWRLQTTHTDGRKSTIVNYDFDVCP